LSRRLKKFDRPGSWGNTAAGGRAGGGQEEVHAEVGKKSKGWKNAGRLESRGIIEIHGGDLRPKAPLAL